MSKVPFALCDKCPLKDRDIAKSTGPKDAKVAVVSRSPGVNEARSGQSFAGPSGKVLDHLLKLQGVQREQVLATNVVLCQADGTEPGFGLAMACCEPRLRHETAKADTIIACGSEAVKSLMSRQPGGFYGGISHNRGAPHTIVNELGKTQKVIVTNNPAMVLRDDKAFPELVRDFRLAINPLPTPKLPTVKWIEDLDDARAAVDSILTTIQSGTLVAADIEARGMDGRSGLEHTAQVVCAGFSIRSERAVVFGERPCTDEAFIREYLNKLYTHSDVRYLWHNGKYDIKVLRHKGIQARMDEDTMLLSWCLDERPGDPTSGAGGHSLEWLLKDELGWPKYESQCVKHFKKTGSFDFYVTKDMDERQAEQARKRARTELYTYNGMDTAGALALFDVLKREAINDNVWDRPYKSQLIRLSETLTRVELVGNLFDTEAACDVLEDEVWPKLDEQRSTMRTMVHKPKLNPRSNKQISEMWYDEWGLQHNLMRPAVERQGKRSVDKSVRDELLKVGFRVDGGVDKKAVEQFVKRYDDFQSLDKQRGTYFEGLVLRVHPNGRLYTDFKISGTESGRLSSSNPNLQNVTRPKEGLPSIRNAFIPDPGCLFISADLSQAELRTIALLSGDTNLRAIYLDTSRSLHKEVAREFYGDGYSYEQYVRAKNINFGVAYWQSAYTFAQMYHMPQKEAQGFIDFWWDRFPQVWEWTKTMEDAVLTKGEIQSPFGHKRRFYVIPQDKGGRLHVVKEGINFKPQNIAANITLWALCELGEKLDWSIAQPRLTVHDSILVNCKIDHVDGVAKLMQSCLEAAPKQSLGWDFPFKCDVSVGPNYAELSELALE